MKTAEVGLRCSAGIATNKLCAKLVSGLPNPTSDHPAPGEAAATVAPPVRALPGIGSKPERELLSRGLSTAAEVRGFSREQLCAGGSDRV